MKGRSGERSIPVEDREHQVGERSIPGAGREHREDHHGGQRS